MMLKTTLVISLIAASLAHANPTADVERRLKEMYPATNIVAARQSEVEGLFEVQMGRNIAFTDKTGRYFVFGHMFDMVNQVDLTAQRIADIGRVDFTGLPLQDAIVTVRGSGSRKLAVFSDPDCSFCQKLEAELAKLDNVTIFTFLFPLAGLHPEAQGKAERVWCAKDRDKAWAELMSEGKQPAVAVCVTPIERNLRLGESLGIRGTPTIILSDGHLIPGALPAAELDKRLAGVQQPNVAAKPKTTGN